MSDTYSEFLTENELRAYPLVEDADLRDVGNLFTLPQDVILDFRGYHRAKIEIQPRLAAIVPSGAPVDIEYPVIPGFTTIYFECGPASSPLRLATTIPDGYENWPYTTDASIEDPAYPGVKIAYCRVTYGAGVADLSPTNRWHFLQARLEPALMAQLYRAQVDLVKVIHATGDPEFVGGDVKLRGGHSVVLNQDDEARSIEMEATPGSGEFGRFTGTRISEDENRCRGILAINKVNANTRGEFFLTAGRGLEVINLPLENKIQIRMIRSTMDNPSC